MKKKTSMLAVIAVVAVFCVAIVIPQYLFLSTKDLSRKIPIGIIDGSLSNHHVLISETNATEYSDSVTHGDKLLAFLAHFDVGEVYYYDASSGGVVSSQNIIEGLDWMKSKGAQHVNISLSSKQYSQELAEWIADNQTVITVYASFSNTAQSADYPAMYDGVIASGTERDFADNTDDCIYTSNKIIIDWDFLEVYSGNSFLSLWTMLSQINNT